MKNQTLMRSLAGGALLLTLTLSASAQPGPRDGMRGGPQRGSRAKGELNRVWHDIAALEGGKLAFSQAQSAQVVALVLPVSKQKTLGDDNAQTLADKIEAVFTSAQRAQIDQDHPRGPRGNRPPGGPMGKPMDGPPPRDVHNDNGRGRRGDGPPPRDGGRDGRGPRGRDGGPPRMDRADFEKVRPFMEALNLEALNLEALNLEALNLEALNLEALNPFYPPTGYAEFKALSADFARETARLYGERRALLETLSKREKGK